jgi:hypothetical protein
MGNDLQLGRPPLAIDALRVWARFCSRRHFGGGLQVFPGGGFRIDSATLRSLIAFAYDLREE